MKLYTEEQIFNAYYNGWHYRSVSFVNGEVGKFPFYRDEFINSLNPIELPSDEEIDVHIEDDFINAIEIHKYSEEAQLLMKAMCKAGALWMRDKIQGGNNEQQ